MALAHSPQDFPPETRALAAQAILNQFGKALAQDLLPSDPSVLRTFLFSRCDNEGEESKLFGCVLVVGRPRRPPRRRRRGGAGAPAWPARPRSHHFSPLAGLVKP